MAPCCMSHMSGRCSSSLWCVWLRKNVVRLIVPFFLALCAAQCGRPLHFGSKNQVACIIGAPPRRALAVGTLFGGLCPSSVGAIPGSFTRKKFKEVIAESGLDDWKVKDYEAMRDDVPRTSKFQAAIRRRLAGFKGDATVVDIGTGPFALLAIFAALAGAKKVYAIEINAAAAASARETVARAGLAHKVVVLEGDSMKLDLPERVDLVVSELIGSIAGQEGVEPIIRDAGKRFLKDGVGAAGMIPASCQTCISPVFYRGRTKLAKITNYFAGLRSRGIAEDGSVLPLRINASIRTISYFWRSRSCWKTSTTDQAMPIRSRRRRPSLSPLIPRKSHMMRSWVLRCTIGQISHLIPLLVSRCGLEWSLTTRTSSM